MFGSHPNSIDRKLPLLASGLVLVTVAVVGLTAYASFEKALLQASSDRLSTSAHVVASLLQLPTQRVDNVVRQNAAVLRSFLRSGRNRDQVRRVLELGSGPESTRVYAALLDPSGGVLLVRFRRDSVLLPWASSAVAGHAIEGDSVTIGPVEDAKGAPATTLIRAIRDTSRKRPVLGYYVEAWRLAGRGARAVRSIIGEDVQMIVGQPGTPKWTDLERVVPPPPLRIADDTTVVYRGRVGASARLRNHRWVVWVSEPTRVVTMPARLLLWEMAPLALLIAVVAAALMWVVARRITHPVAEVTSAIEAIARDTHSMTAEHEIAADLAHADEVKRLRFAVDHMADRVARAQLIEAQLRQSQKMEAIGRLAGGVAHDFNNILTAIRAHADLLLDDMSEWDGRRGDVEEIRKSSERAAALTAQLLAFSRNQVIEPRLLNPRVVLSEVELMLRRLMVEDIQVSITAPAELWSVRADRGQLEQVILNLSVNARDAMPHGGALRIAASNETVDSPFHTRLGVIPPGDYVAIRVTDTGLGMDLVTQSRAFEPFFTTKPVGKGTGLGLATVHGIIAQNRGYVNMVSAPAEGTTFTVYLPRARGEQEGKPMRTSGPSKPKSGSETILLVEDEPAVRALARRVLERAGFTVLESQTPADALLIANNAEQVDLILTDVVMPGMNGPELVMHLTPLWPEARVLYTSGHTDDEMIGRGLPNGDFELLHKPFSAQQLVARVRAVLTS